MARVNVVESAQDAAERAGAYVQAGMTRALRRARALAQDTSARVEELAGRSAEAWAVGARAFLRDRPLQTVLGMIALGYVAGKILGRRKR